MAQTMALTTTMTPKLATTNTSRCSSCSNGGCCHHIVTNVRSQVICHATPSWDRFYFCYLSIFAINYLLTRSIFAIYDSTVFLLISIILRVYLSSFPFLVYIFLLYKP